MNAEQKYFNTAVWSRAEMRQEKEALTFSSHTQWRFYLVSLARAPVLGETHRKLSRWLLCETKKDPVLFYNQSAQRLHRPVLAAVTG